MRGLLGRQRRMFCGVQRRYYCAANGTSFGSDMPKAYDPSSVEEKILEKWKCSFRKRNNAGKDKPVFRMLLPPPNVTGKLHLGHFLTLTVEDTIARWKLMTGLDIDWIPGFDHAGIATQSVVNRKMSKNKDGSTVGDNLKGFSSSNLDLIRQQLMASGALLNWDSEYYTLDERHSQTVKEAFIQLYENGLIRRADGIVNWSCAIQTTVADIEVDNISFDKRMTLRVPNYEFPIQFGVLYHVAYSLLDSDEKIIVATSRPETMFGDVALAVNKEDFRYAKYVGKMAINPLNGNTISIITDERGVPRFLARKRVIEILNHKNAIVDEKEYSGSVGVCSRSGDVIEPRLVPHWFLQTQLLSSKLVQAIEDKSFLIVPENHARSLVHKLNEAREWCLSRQIQWGHRIPAYYHLNHPDKWVAAADVQTATLKLEQSLGFKITDPAEVVQDNDVLDTWFSSALIPLSVSDWPNSESFKEIHLMETGSDILLFWVWRMTILTLALVNRFPFRHVLLHGIVTDHFGRKMSKSKGNVIDPVHIVNGISYEELVKESENSFAAGELDENEFSLRKIALEKHHPKGFPVCGSDALRLTLLSQNLFDQDISLDLNYLDSCKRFSNKLWQALRFLKLNSNSNEAKENVSPSVSSDSSEHLPSKWILACLYEFNKTCESALNQAKFHLYAEAIRKFFYQELCDVYIELVKGDIKTDPEANRRNSLVMQYVFETGVKLAHPLIPFVTEEVWSYLKNDDTTSLLEQKFPSSQDIDQFCDPVLIETMSRSIQFTREIRAIKKKSGWLSKDPPDVFIEMEKSLEKQLHNLSSSIGKLSNSNVQFGKFPAKEKGSYGSFIVDIDGNICKIHIPVLATIDKSVNHNKLEKLKLKLIKLQQQYENPSFQQNAPPAAKEKLKKKVETLILQISESMQNQNPNHPQ
ncbi:Valine--tRNA ligase, mitochondrial 1 [Orchesella cincta]|uniref:valine--tRNA ligase n=1 Tax=Orchesella cincta TaxID=48709 RepID=A0A1D2MZS4_ORCCI|nr:Valine--tRNA ligase, mitochondrial 1 [Orchesella cincta]